MKTEGDDVITRFNRAMEVLTIFQTEELRDIIDAAEERGVDWKSIIHDTVMDEIAK